MRDRQDTEQALRENWWEGLKVDLRDLEEVT
jgi:hypothetical protein